MRIETEVDPAKLDEWMVNRLRDTHDAEFDWSIDLPINEAAEQQPDIVKALRLVHNLFAPWGTEI
jgi:hypothetical protein